MGTRYDASAPPKSAALPKEVTNDLPVVEGYQGGKPSDKVN